MNSVAISLKALSFRYPGKADETLAISDFDVAAGERVALIGSSGAGKTTLLRLLDGRLRGWKGTARVLGEALSPQAPPSRSWRCQTGFVFQDFALIEQATVYQNVLNGRLGRAHPWWSLVGRFDAADEDAVLTALQDVGIEDLADQRTDELSGGQRQRVAIARCLAQNPNLLLVDEPVSNLDPVTADTILTLLRESATRRGATLILTSHQPRLVSRYVNRIVALDNGSIVFDGTPQELRDQKLAEIYEASKRQPLPELQA